MNQDVDLYGEIVWTLDEGYFVLKPEMIDGDWSRLSYEIPVEKVDTREQMDEWIRHLGSKTWASETVLSDFREIVLVFHGWEL